MTCDRSVLLLAALVVASCGRGAAPQTTSAESSAPSGPVRVETSAAVERPLARFINVTGTLTAQESADVAAEIAGRVVATPVERGMAVEPGTELVRISAEEVEAQAQEADANAAQIVARLGQPDGEAFSVDRVPEVAAARASRDLARAELERVTVLFDRRLVSRAEHDARVAQTESAERQYETARNAAEQQRQALAAARARVTLARKALADTVVRAPFTGVVSERHVSAGDYVTRGTRVVSVLRVNPLRLELTVPAQYIAAVAAGRSVTLQVDAYPGRTFTGTIRFVSPDVRAESRSLLVEAVVPNEDDLLKPGLFVNARVEEKAPSPGILVPASAVRTVADTSRVFVLAGDHVEAHIVTLGQAVDGLVEITSGLPAGAVVATSNVAQLSDGARVAAE